VPSTKSSRSIILRLEAKAILASIPSTVRAGVWAIYDHTRRRRSLSSFHRRLSSGKPTASPLQPRFRSNGGRPGSAVEERQALTDDRGLDGQASDKLAARAN
jgi:hypothetical protein